MGVFLMRWGYPQNKTQHHYRLPKNQRSLGRGYTSTKRVSEGSYLPLRMDKKKDRRRKKRCWRVFGVYAGRIPRRYRHHPHSPRRPRNNHLPSLLHSLRPLALLPLQGLPAVVAGRKRQAVAGADAPNHPPHPHQHHPSPLPHPSPPPQPRSPNW